MINKLSWPGKLVRTLGELKFAVIIISIFAVVLAYGTFMESYHGAEFANRFIYKSLPFMALQALMFLSILSATLLRLPARKSLYGFYTLHAGLLILFIGSLITYIAGIDGNITLAPNNPARHIVLPEHQLKIEYKGEEFTMDLPYNAFETKLNYQYKDIEIERFLPFGKKTVEWRKAKSPNDVTTSAKYLLFNERMAETFHLSLHPKADFQSTKSLGPLNIHYLPKALAECFEQAPKSRYVIWNAKKNTCTTPEAGTAEIKKNAQEQTYIELMDDWQKLTFFPDTSPLPVDGSNKIIEDSPYRIFSQKIFQSKPHLFSFGDSIAYYLPSDDRWKVVGFKGEEKKAELPWMGFSLQLKRFETQKYPVIAPKYVKPVNDNNEIIEGDLKAISLLVHDERVWVTDQAPLHLSINGESLKARITQKTIALPFELTLSRFKMDNDPGTKNPASYESFVRLFTGEETQKHHIYMNNPLKKSNFTFYQASYFEMGEGQYGSVLSANYDPGRPLKYLGSLLLVLGSIWHFVIRSKKKRRFFSREVLSEQAN